MLDALELMMRLIMYVNIWPLQTKSIILKSCTKLREVKIYFNLKKKQLLKLVAKSNLFGFQEQDRLSFYTQINQTSQSYIPSFIKEVSRHSSTSIYIL